MDLLSEEYINSPEKHINFRGKDWAVIKAYLLGRQEQLLSSLCGDLSHDATNVTRGDLRRIRDLLFLEQAAFQSRQQE